MNEIDNTLSTFESISLKEMDNVKLMDRTDIKYSFTVSHLPELLSNLQKHYRLLYVENKSILSYNSLYFDTPEFTMYRNHHNGVLNRYKIRYRSYVDSYNAFLEVKFKNNKGRTIKDRITCSDIADVFNAQAKAFIQKKTPYVTEQLQPVIWVNYKRITLVDKLLKERVTIDLELEFMHGNKRHKMENLVIAEVKRVGKSSSKMLLALKELKLKPVSISKYCLGMTFMYSELKKNNFKEKLHLLNKTLHDNTVKFAAGKH